MTIKQFIRNVFISIDQSVNVTLGGNPDETLSSRAHRMKVKGHKYWWWVAAAINSIFFWQDDHCKQAYLSEVNRVQLPKHFRK